MKLVTFVLFLASLAVMEYLLRKPSKKTNDDSKGMNGGAAQNPLAAIPTMPGLFALGEALDAQGRGKVPGVEKAPQVYAPPVDGV
jgi:hypothetical protein